MHELTRAAAIPHGRLPSSRRCLFLESELLLWESGAQLDVKGLGEGERLVVPISPAGP